MNRGMVFQEYVTQKWTNTLLCKCIHECEMQEEADAYEVLLLRRTSNLAAVNVQTKPKQKCIID